MTDYRIFPSTNGPATATSYVGNPYIAGVLFQVTQAGMWFEGYWWWCCGTGQTTTPVECALWQPHLTGTGSYTATLIPGTTATSGTLTAGAWNYIPLTSPVPLAMGTPYTPAIAQNGSFPDTQSQFGSGDPFTNGITNGPLVCYSSAADNGATNRSPYSFPQGIYTTSGTDPTVYPPSGGNSASNLWADVQVSDVAPSTYAGTYRLWPNKYDASPSTILDTNLNFTLATEIHFSQAVTASWLWFYSYHNGSSLAASLPTWAGVYSSTGTPGVTSYIAQNASPTWLTPSGSAAAAGGGWCKCAITANLPAGAYKVAVYNANGSSNTLGWSCTEYGYFLVGDGINGISGFGSISSPSNGNATTNYVFSNNGASTPPFTQVVTEPGNNSFARDSALVSNAPQYPYLVVDQNYGGPAGVNGESFWIDLEVTPASSPPSPLAGSGTGIPIIAQFIK